MSKDLQLLGFYVEENRDGPRFVLVQSYVGSDGTTEEIEHEAPNPEALWATFCAMYEDPGKPAVQGPAPEEYDSPPTSPSDALMRAGLEEAQILVASAAGPVAGRLAGALLRNPEHARAIGRRVVDTIRSVSRGDRAPRARRDR